MGGAGGERSDLRALQGGPGEERCQDREGNRPQAAALSMQNRLLPGGTEDGSLLISLSLPVFPFFLRIHLFGEKKQRGKEKKKREKKTGVEMKSVFRMLETSGFIFTD